MPGTRYLKVDLHFHTPASRDYRDKVDHAAVLAAAAAAEIDVLAITDHNTIAGVKPSVAAAKAHGITILPGVEISTADGHVLAVFDANKPLEDIDAWLTQLGFPPSMRGDDKALAGGDDPPLSMIEVADRIESAGGVAIAAHVCTKSIGFWEALKHRGALRIKIHACKALRALEVTNPAHVPHVSGGQSPDYPKRYACVMGSDAHDLAEIGKRATWMKLGDVSTFGLKHALADPLSRIFLEGPPDVTGPRIKQISVEGGFFDGLVFDLHAELNCVIGGKGVGKSLLIELCRFGLGMPSAIEAIREDAEGKVNARLGSDGTVSLLVCDEHGTEYRIERVGTADIPTVYRASDLRELEVLPKDIFPAQIFGQGEFVEIAREPRAQLHWIDESIDVALERRRIEEARREARDLGKRIVSATGLISRKAEVARSVKAGEVARKPLASKLKDPLLKEFPGWTREKALIQEAKNAVETLASDLEDALEEVRAEIAEPELEGLPNAPTMRAVYSEVAAAEKDIADARNQLAKKMQARRARIDTATKNWRGEFEKKHRAHAALLKEVKVKDESEISRKLLALDTQLGKEKGELAKIAQAEKQRKNLLRSRREALDALAAAYSAIYEKRSRRAAEVTALTSGFVKVEVQQMSDRSAFVVALGRLLRGLRLSEDARRRIADALTPIEFPLAFLSADDQPDLAEAVAFLGADRITRIREHLQELPTDDLFELQLTELADRATISLKLEGGKYRELARLSDGQRCTALLAMALIERNGPLLIDQPEDALDNPYVFRGLVQSIRKQRHKRQLVFTTHNPNLVVASDADCVFTLAADDEQGRIEDCGSIDSWATRGHVLTNIEGAEEAFYLRGQKYSIDFSDPTKIVFFKEPEGKD